MLRRILVLSGGQSDEREVSLRSGKACEEALNELGFEVENIDFQGPESVPAILAFKADLVFLTTHGGRGEDGTLQGLLDCLEIPYVGSGVHASALCMDKYLTKLLLKNFQLPTSKVCLYEDASSFQSLCAAWQCSALFIKPRHGGSSIGAKIIKTEKDWNEIVVKEACIVEPYLMGREITLGWIQKEKEWEMLPTLELKPKNTFYDYEAKYTKGLTEFIVPAELSTEELEELENISRQVVERCEVEGIARVDFLLTEAGPYILEVNTLPGMTELSDVPAQAKAAGWSFPQLVKTLVESVES